MIEIPFAVLIRAATLEAGLLLERSHNTLCLTWSDKKLLGQFCRSQLSISQKFANSVFLVMRQLYYDIYYDIFRFYTDIYTVITTV